MTRYLPLAEAEALVASAIAAANTSSANARSVASALVAAEVDGQGGHGFSRVAAYAAQAKAGKVDGHASPKVTRPKPAVLKIDAAHGFAYPALDTAAAELPELAKAQGLAAAPINRSHHCGTLTRHVERVAEAGCVALMFANAPKAMAPWGGNAPLLGTNPIGFAVPRLGKPPLVIDLSLSKVARGKVMAAAKRGEAIPEGWALAQDGRPTTNAEAALAGSMIPAGEAKGAALALMVEILAVSLTGSVYSFEASSFFDDKGPPPAVGQLLIALSPPALAGPGFLERIEELFGAIVAQEGARLPGQRRLAGRAHAAEHGVAISDALYAEINELASV